jgi:hypothetical protein
MTQPSRLVSNPLGPRDAKLGQCTFREPIVQTVDFVADGNIRETLAAFRDFAGKLMAEHGRTTNTALSGMRGRVPEQLTGRNGHGMNPYNNFTGLRLGLWHLLLNQ